jgi:hypothetical protein
MASLARTAEISRGQFYQQFARRAITGIYRRARVVLKKYRDKNTKRYWAISSVVHDAVNAFGSVLIQTSGKVTDHSTNLWSSLKTRDPEAQWKSTLRDIY